MKNAVGREIPDELVKKHSLKLYNGPFELEPTGKMKDPTISKINPSASKIVSNIEEAIKKVGLKDGMTISFHHHFRSGDYILNKVIDVIAKFGIKNLTLASSSLLDIHYPLIEHVKNGVISKIETSGLRGPLANEISSGLMDNPVIIRSHGGRARAIESGDLHIDVAFLGVPSCDEYGNAKGSIGKTLCGSLGYAMV